MSFPLEPGRFTGNLERLSPRHHALAYGLHWQSDFPLPPFAKRQPAGDLPQISVEHAIEPSLERQPLRANGPITQFPDGFRYRMDEITVESFGRDKVRVWPGSTLESRRDMLPPAFFGTFTGLLLAWRGLIPIHGSAIEMDGRAVLICGKARTGKSTLTAGLIAAGAKLISDDLSVVHPGILGQAPTLYGGRTTLRLHPATAGYLGESVAWSAPASTADGKLVVSPPRVDPAQPFSLVAMLLLGDAIGEVTGAERTVAFQAQLYRPAWTRRWLGGFRRRAQLQFTAQQVVMRRVPAIVVGSRADFRKSTAEVLEIIRGML